MPAVIYKIAKAELPGITGAKTSILKTLAYFDIFHYPLSKDEIQQFLDRKIDKIQLETTLAELMDDKRIFQYNSFYSLHDNPVPGYRRTLGNKRAEKILPKAEKIGRFLYRFPFVRAIAVSGSLSKNFADAKADIDFFIITKANRLWMARTCMHLFKKLTFLTGTQHLYCMNYYIDEKALQVEDKNIFTAIEVKTLLPVCGAKTIKRFVEANQWTDSWLPATNFRNQNGREPKRGLLKRIGEWLLNNKLGDWMDNYLMRLTNRRWERKRELGKQNEKGQTMGLITGKHFARSNPGAFQEKVLEFYEQKLEALEIADEE